MFYVFSDVENLKKSVTFVSQSSFIRMVAWQLGLLQFSFRTLQDAAVLLHQAATEENDNYFTITLVSGTSKCKIFVSEFIIDKISHKTLK